MRTSTIVILPFFALFSVSAKSQMETLFYGRPYIDVNPLIDSVKMALPESYRVTDRGFSKNGKEEYVAFRDSAGVYFHMSIIKVDDGKEEKIGTVMIQGRFKPMLSFYLRYFKRDVKGAQRESGCWPLIVKNTEFGKMPISFCQNDGTMKDIWFLENKVPYQTHK